MAGGVQWVLGRAVGPMCVRGAGDGGCRTHKGAKLWESRASKEQRVGHLAWEREDGAAVKSQDTQGYLEGDWNSVAPIQPWLAILESQRQGDVGLSCFKALVSLAGSSEGSELNTGQGLTSNPMPGWSEWRCRLPTVTRLPFSGFNCLPASAST